VVAVLIDVADGKAEGPPRRTEEVVKRLIMSDLGSVIEEALRELLEVLGGKGGIPASLDGSAERFIKSISPPEGFAGGIVAVGPEPNKSAVKSGGPAKVGDLMAGETPVGVRDLKEGGI
jgi:hypothetical protein